MAIPWYEVGIFVGGAIAGSLISQVIKDIYPILRGVTITAVSKLYNYAPHKMWKRRKKRKRGEIKAKELVEAIKEDPEFDNDEN